MNVMITLPRHLIDAIYSGRKTFELRPSRPKYFSLLNDRVYVVEKGTKHVVMSFRCSCFTSWFDADLLWEYCGGKLAVSKEFYQKYVNSKKALCLWSINDVCMYHPAIPMTLRFGVKHAPQSYVYVNEPCNC